MHRRLSKKPLEISHNNPNLAIVDVKNLRGGSFNVEDITERNNIPPNKRGKGFYFVKSENKIYTYIGSVDEHSEIYVSDVDWVNLSNWQTVVSSETSNNTLSNLTVDFTTNDGDGKLILGEPLVYDTANWEIGLSDSGDSLSGLTMNLGFSGESIIDTSETHTMATPVTVTGSTSGLFQSFEIQGTDKFGNTVVSNQPFDIYLYDRVIMGYTADRDSSTFQTDFQLGNTITQTVKSYGSETEGIKFNGNTDTDDVNNYTVILYPTSFGQIDNIFLNDGESVLNSFELKGASITLTNAYGVDTEYHVYVSYDSGAFNDTQDLTINLKEVFNSLDQKVLEDILEKSKTGYSHTGAFAGKPLSNNYVWESGDGVFYTQQDVEDDLYKVFSLDYDVHLAVDNPYWSVPATSGQKGIGLFEGSNLPVGVSSLVDYQYDYDTENSSITHQYYALNGGTQTGYEGSTGRIKLNDCNYGDLLRVRFDFNVIQQVPDTTITPALWYSNRNDNDEITFTFDLTAQPIKLGSSNLGQARLNRIPLSAWITSNEDVNALILPAIKSDNPVIIQPLGLLITISR